MSKRSPRCNVLVESYDTPQAISRMVSSCACYASVAQWIEHRPSNPGVAGSIPARGTHNFISECSVIGSTFDFGSDSSGSSPGTPAEYHLDFRKDAAKIDQVLKNSHRAGVVNQVQILFSMLMEDTVRM